MPPTRKVPSSANKFAREGEPFGKPAKKHPLLLALAAIVTAAWMGFLAWLAFRT
jgi:hypothetical protein